MASTQDTGLLLGLSDRVGNSSTVIECSTFSNLGNGIYATSSTGAMSSPGGSSLISRCTSTLDASSPPLIPVPGGTGGIVVESGIVEHCTVDTSGGDGILAFGGFPTTQIIGCNVLHAVGNGIHVFSASEVRDCSVTESELNGILVDDSGSTSRIIGNTLRSNGTSGLPGLFAGIQVAD
ncbi:MAG: right-handed parallel beta-helix repeat-containing protein, partial [Proteobacteria bacterium]|nr:right-handed parallel beta-helix repeat-containing protein [Pseudomonadota bacterium]